MDRWGARGAREDRRMILLAVLVALESASLLGAAALARREPLHRWIVALTAYALADELAIEALHRWALAGAARPFVGWTRAAYHLETGIFLGWPALLCAVSWSVFAWPKPTPRGQPRSEVASVARVLAFAAWLGTLAAFVLRFPLPHGATAPLLHAYQGAAVLAALAAVPAAWRRLWGLPHAAVLVLVAIELAVSTIGPFVRNPFADWHLARIGYVLGFGTLAALQVRAMRRPPG